MHDPKTVAFEIPHPFFPHRFGMGEHSHLYWPKLLVIWHVDPETDGSDNSCGWSYPNLTKEQQSQIRFLAGCEARDPWFTKEKKKAPTSPSDAQALCVSAFWIVARQLRIKLTVEQAMAHAIQLTHHPVDNLRSRLCYLPGYHSNSKEDTEEQRAQAAGELFMCCARVLLREARPWWRHPRWHIWHWELQCPPLQNFKRWVWGRCRVCGKRFKWGEAPISNQWHSKGPQWFQGETDIAHDKCSGVGCAQTEPKEAACR